MPVMNMKTCRDCKETKPLDEFYRAPECKQGRQPRCKVCQKAYMKTLNSPSWAEKARKIRADNPIKAKARSKFDYAVKTGKLIKAKHCSECGSAENIHGHHDDYSEPLLVRWLCQKCHNQWHVENDWKMPVKKQA